MEYCKDRVKRRLIRIWAEVYTQLILRLAGDIQKAYKIVGVNLLEIGSLKTCRHHENKKDSRSLSAN